MKTHRKRWSLTQEELAHLLGISRTAVSRLEKDDAPPSLRVALALEVVFGLPPRALLPRLYREVEEFVVQRAASFSVRAEEEGGPGLEARRELLADIAGRALGLFRA